MPVIYNNHNFDYNKHVARPYNGQSDNRGNKLTILWFDTYNNK